MSIRSAVAQYVPGCACAHRTGDHHCFICFVGQPRCSALSIILDLTCACRPAFVRAHLALSLVHRGQPNQSMTCTRPRNEGLCCVHGGGKSLPTCSGPVSKVSCGASVFIFSSELLNNVVALYPRFRTPNHLPKSCGVRTRSPSTLKASTHRTDAQIDSGTLFSLHFILSYRGKGVWTHTYITSKLP